jgi:SAM-dependent methyltransferase
MSCQQCRGIEQQFDEKSSRRKLARYRRRGPDKTTRMLIDELHRVLDADDAGGTLLDIGAGFGAIHHALLNGRLTRAVHVEASPGQLEMAREETTRRGHEAAVEFVHGDFVTVADSLPGADVVTLDRVICCFDDMESLVRLSAEKARRFYGAVYPRDVGWMRIALAVINIVSRLKQSPFRVFLHRPSAIHANLVSAGLDLRITRRTAGWEVVVYERRPGASSSTNTTTCSP